ncbi:MAG: hypothetical protein LBF25_00400 [Puniceicoccales bacterium]|jgi:hypothetical protein|nr:hypothetical protein [Puniceicoccales bacterium]
MEINDFSEELNNDHFMYSDFPDPEEVRQYSEKFNKEALKPMLDWVQKKTATPDKIVQYEEVINELEKFSPKYCCEMVFCKNVLLHELEKAGVLPSLPPSLIVVLNTLHLVHSEGTRLVSVDKNGADVIFKAEFDSWVGGKIVTDTCKYRLHNYLFPEKYELTVLEITPGKAA